MELYENEIKNVVYERYIKMLSRGSPLEYSQTSTPFDLLKLDYN